MIEKRNCEICTVPENKGCYMKMAEEIKKMADTLPEPSPNLSEEEKFREGQNMGLAVNNEIEKLRDEARKNYCQKVNDIVAEGNKWNKYL